MYNRQLVNGHCTQKQFTVLKNGTRVFLHVQEDENKEKFINVVNAVSKVREKNL
jgi:hypothetical protein